MSVFLLFVVGLPVRFASISWILTAFGLKYSLLSCYFRTSRVSCQVVG